MLTLHTFGPHFGLPDASPFCIKGQVLMKMSGLAFNEAKFKFGKAPKGKGPYLEDNGKMIGDTHFIQRHLEVVHNADFSGGYAKAELDRAWPLARMVEEHLYFINGNIRWNRDENFWKGPYQFFADAPAPIRPLIARVIRRKRAKGALAQGLSRHTDAELLELARGDFDAIEATLVKKPFILGDKPCWVDASVFSELWSTECPFFTSEVGDEIRVRPILMDYLRRMAAKYFPDYKVT